MLLLKEAPRAVIFITVLFSAFLLAGGCAKAPPPVPVAGWEPLADEYFPIKLEVPSGWHLASEGNRVLVYSSTEAMDRFHNPASTGPMGAQFIGAYEKQSDPQPLETYVSAFVNEMTTAGFTVGPPVPGTMSGESALRVDYRGHVDKKNELRNTRLYAMKDGTLYYLQYSAFNDLYDFHAPARDHFFESAKLPSGMVVAGDDPSIPSATTTTFSNGFLSITHPANFEATTPTPKSGTEFSLQLTGYRQDSTIRVDVLPAKGLAVEKVFEQNAPLFKGRSNGETNISGQKAMFVNYAPARDVTGRAYFIVKGDKVYRIVSTWHTPMKDVYQPVFEQTVASLQIK